MRDAMYIDLAFLVFSISKSKSESTLLQPQSLIERMTPSRAKSEHTATRNPKVERMRSSHQPGPRTITYGDAQSHCRNSDFVTSTRSKSEHTATRSPKVEIVTSSHQPGPRAITYGDTQSHCRKSDCVTSTMSNSEHTATRGPKVERMNSSYKSDNIRRHAVPW